MSEINPNNGQNSAMVKF